MLVELVLEHVAPYLYRRDLITLSQICQSYATMFSREYFYGKLDAHIFYKVYTPIYYRLKLAKYIYYILCINNKMTNVFIKTFKLTADTTSLSYKEYEIYIECHCDHWEAERLAFEYDSMVGLSLDCSNTEKCKCYPCMIEKFRILIEN